MINFAKKDDNVKIPSRRSGDGCYDIYAHFEDNDMTIYGNSVKLIPTGLYSQFSNNYRVGIRERGSNVKSFLITMAGQIDSNYRGEWFVALYNPSSQPVCISKEVSEITKHSDIVYIPYSKAIAQFAIEIVPDVAINEVTIESIINDKTERGDGKLGSSGK